VTVMLALPVLALGALTLRQMGQVALPPHLVITAALGAILHATLEDWFGWFADAGFRVRALREPRPTEEAVRARPELEDAARVPYFLILDLVSDGAPPGA